MIRFLIIRLAAISLLLVPAGPAGSHPSALERIERLDAAIRAHPEDPANYVRRGQVERDLGRFERARRDFEQAERLGDPILVAYDRGVLLHRMGELAQARRALDAFLARFPRHPQALEARAQVARDQGDSATSLADYRAYFAVHASPHPGDYVSAAKMLASAPDGGVESALTMLDEGMVRLGQTPQLQRPAIELERRRGRDDLALARLESLATSLGESAEWKVDRAEALLRVARIADASSQLEAAKLQLDRLAATRARQRLRVRIEALEREIEAARIASSSSKPGDVP